MGPNQYNSLCSLFRFNPFKLTRRDGSTTKSLHEDIWRDISTIECVAIYSQPKCVIYWVINYRKWNKCLKNMTPGMVPWYGLTVPWLKAEKVWFMSSCTPFINRTIIEEVQCFREGNHQDWRGIQISVLVCHSVFFQRSTYRLKWNVFKFDIFANSFTIFRGLCAFSRH